MSKPNPLHDRRHGSRRRLLMGAAAGAALAGWSRTASAQGGGSVVPGEGTTAPELPAVGARLALPQVALLDGGTFRPADAEGRVLVIYWWASWCPFCAQQSPHMQALWERERGRGLAMLALAIDRRAEDARGYLQKKGYTFPAGLATPEVSRVLPKPKGLPVTVVRGRDGRVLQAERGQLFPEDVQELARWLA